MHVSVNCVLVDFSNYQSNICVISKNLNGLQSFKIHYFNYTDDYYYDYRGTI